jgi:DNA-directed RNA polymerase beta subunit
MMGHGSIAFLKERFFDNSDKFLFHLCKDCGQIAVANKQKNIYKCLYCDNDKNFSQVQVPYSTKLMINEVSTMGIRMNLRTS